MPTIGRGSFDWASLTVPVRINCSAACMLVKEQHNNRRRLLRKWTVFMKGQNRLYTKGVCYFKTAKIPKSLTWDNRFNRFLEQSLRICCFLRPLLFLRETVFLLAALFEQWWQNGNTFLHPFFLNEGKVQSHGIEAFAVCPKEVACDIGNACSQSVIIQFHYIDGLWQCEP